MNRLSHKHTKRLKCRRQSGVAALLVIVILSAAVLVIAQSAAFIGIGELSHGYIDKTGSEARALAEGCAEEALLRLRRDAGYAVTDHALPTSRGSCTITVSADGSERTIVARGALRGFHRELTIILDVATGVPVIVSWRDT